MALPIQRRANMKKSWLIAYTILAIVAGLNFAETVQLNQARDILSALKSGNQVRVVFHYKDCKLVIDGEAVEEVPDAIGGMAMNTFEYFAPHSIGNERGFIASSQNVLINHPSYGFVFNYVKLNVYDDGDVKIVAKYLTPGDLAVKMDESFHTIVNDGKNTGAAYFYLVK